MKRFLIISAGFTFLLLSTSLFISNSNVYAAEKTKFQVWIGVSGAERTWTYTEYSAVQAKASAESDLRRFSGYSNYKVWKIDKNVNGSWVTVFNNGSFNLSSGSTASTPRTTTSTARPTTVAPAAVNHTFNVYLRCKGMLQGRQVNRIYKYKVVAPNQSKAIGKAVAASIRQSLQCASNPVKIEQLD